MKKISNFSNVFRSENSSEINRIFRLSRLKINFMNIHQVRVKLASNVLDLEVNSVFEIRLPFVWGEETTRLLFLWNIRRYSPCLCSIFRINFEYRDKGKDGDFDVMKLSVFFFFFFGIFYVWKCVIFFMISMILEYNSKRVYLGIKRNH